MRLALETYNNHLWLSTVFHPPSELSFHSNSFLPPPHLGGASFQPPLSQPTNMEPIIFPPFFFPHQVPEGATTPWNNVGTNQTFSAMVHNEVRESPPQVVPNISMTTSQVTPYHLNPPLPRTVPN
ncbi:hypothetical protein KY285_035410 [Solanum tuberosum]|nr:hypothetical protein KY285_035410 [Solanum tuberosum]